MDNINGWMKNGRDALKNRNIAKEWKKYDWWKSPINSVEHKEEIMTLKIENGTMHRVHTSCSGN